MLRLEGVVGGNGFRSPSGVARSDPADENFRLVGQLGVQQRNLDFHPTTRGRGGPIAPQRFRPFEVLRPSCILAGSKSSGTYADQN